MKHSLFILIMALIIAGMGVVTVMEVGTPRVLVLENHRSTQAIPWTWSSWMETTFQTRLEEAMADHFPGRDAWLTSFYTLNTTFTDAMRFLVPPKVYGKVIIEAYSDLNRVTINGEAFLIPAPVTMSPSVKKQIQSNMDVLNTMADTLGVNTSLYIVSANRDTSLIYQSFDLDAFTSVIDETLKIPYTVFTVDSHEEFLKTYYRTDHHWTQYGADQGYRQLVEFAFQEDPLPVSQSRCFDGIFFYGSYSRQVAGAINVDGDPVCWYGYDYQPIQISVNGNVVENYGGVQSYVNQAPELKVKYFDHYSRLYTGANAVVEIISGFENKPKVLLIGNSFTAPIRFPLSYHTSHFYYFSADYLNDTMSDFNLAQFVRDHQIDQVILMIQLGQIRQYTYGQELKRLMD